MKHEMKLQNEYFNKIKDQTKTIEMRLNDEKRQKIKLKDIIVFTNLFNEEKIECLVTNIYKYNNFSELYKNHNKLTIGYKQEEDADPKDMEEIYNIEDIKRYGVVGIELKLLV